MFTPITIEGINILNQEIPRELQYWYKFGNIEKLCYEHIYDDIYCKYINCIDLSLTDSKNEYIINVILYNVTGELTFDMSNGFYSGLTIDDCSDWGYEKNNRFRISCFEQTVEFEIYCENIKVELKSKL